MDRRITAWTTADSANPRISAQVISQVIDPVMDRAWMIACMAFSFRLRTSKYYTPLRYIARTAGQAAQMPEAGRRLGATWLP